MSISKTQLYVVMTAILVYFYQGYTHAIFNGLITMESFLERFPETNPSIGTLKEQKHAALIQGTVVAILDVGTAIGSLLCSWLGSKLGSKTVIHIAVLITTCGAIIQISSFSYIQLIVGRVLAGVGLGTFSASVPMWLSECLEAHSRGKITIFTGTFVTFGFVVAAAIDLGFYYIDTHEVSWRVPLALQLLPLVGVFYCSSGACDSPRWLVKQNSIHEAISVLSMLKGVSEDEESIHEEIDAIRTTAWKEQYNSKQSVKTGYRAFLAIWLCILVTLSGINAISFFSTEMFQTQLSFTADKARMLSLGLQLVQLASALVSCWLVEYLGRRRTMMISAAALAVTMGLMGGIGQLHSKTADIFSVILQFVAMIGYPIGFHSTPYMYSAEISPLMSRHIVTSVSSAAHWIFNFMVAEITPIAFSNIHSSYYFIYMAFNFCTLVSLYFLYPETKGYPLEAIDNIFISSDNPLNLVSMFYEGSQTSIASSNFTETIEDKKDTV